MKMKALKILLISMGVMMSCSTEPREERVTCFPNTCNSDKEAQKDCEQQEPEKECSCQCDCRPDDCRCQCSCEGENETGFSTNN